MDAERLALSIELYNGLLPDPILTVSEWADKHRMLSQKAAAEPGPWRTSRTPYLKEIMDCLSPSSRIQQVNFVKGAQLGGTECGLNWIGFVIDVTSGPMLMVQPTVELAKRASKQRIGPLIEESDRLSAKVSDSRSRDSGNTILAKEFPGGILIMTGANSAVGLRSLPAKSLFLDEVDAYPGDVDGEGDPVELAKARTRTFPRKKIFLVSTPTIKGRSRIESAYEESDMRKYHVPCPHCGRFQVLQFARLKWPEDEPQKASYECEHCSKRIEEHHKTEMLANGKWVAEKPEAGEGKVAGFHLSSLYSPIGWMSWAAIAAAWLESKKDPAKLRGFINTILGESWQIKGDAPEWRRLYERREPYRMGVAPLGVLMITAGVDVQKDRLEYELVGWGRGKESWSIDFRQIFGDTSTDAPWTELANLISEQIPHESGSMLPVRLWGVDSGFNTQHVYNWSRKFNSNRVIAIKGVESAQVMVAQPSKVDLDIRGNRIARGARVWPVGINMIKTELYSWLKLEKPLDGEDYQPGFCHFPEYGDEYFQQLTAEQIVTRVIRGYTRHVWEKTRDRNEALDCRVYARAAAYAAGIDRFKDEHWARLEVELGITEKKQITENVKKPLDVSSKTTTPPTLQRRKSSYL